MAESVPLRSVKSEREVSAIRGILDTIFGGSYEMQAVLVLHL